MRRKYKHGRTGVKVSMAQHERHRIWEAGYSNGWRDRHALERRQLAPVLELSTAKDMKTAIRGLIG